MRHAKPAKPTMLLLAAALALCAVGCPSDPFGQYDPSVTSFRWHAEPDSRIEAVGAGEYGFDWQIVAGNGQLYGVERIKYILEGPGEFFRQERDDDGAISLVPIDAAVEYLNISTTYLQYVRNFYRPPPNDEVPAEGARVTFAAEAFNDYAKKWVRSPDYAVTVTRRDKPMDVYILPSTWSDGEWKYHHYEDAYPDELFSRAEVAAGGEYRDFKFFAGPRPGVDTDMRYSLEGPGELTAGNASDYPFGPCVWYFTYTAPDSVEEPIEATAALSVYDPWAKERRERRLVFRVVPK